MDSQKLFTDLVDIVIREGGSDLHLSAGRRPVIRVAGRLYPLVKEPELTEKDTTAVLKILLGEEKYAAFLVNQEVDFSYTTAQNARFRGNAFFQRGTVGVALRLVPATIKTLSELNLPAGLEQFTHLEQGFFLVVGPVGHGKSTTLASLLDIINKERATHIVTIEDPIEYLFTPAQSLIDQREIGMDTKAFHSALKSVFRQDVDVLMIGEMRGPDTMATAVTAAETGHLVFSTLHTNNAAQTIDRIIDTFPPEQQGQIRAQLSQSLAGIFSQRLIQRVSGGLIPAYELLINNSAISNLIREGRTHEVNVVLETSSGDGMITLNRTLADLVRRGEITPDSAMTYSLNPEGLEQML